MIEVGSHENEERCFGEFRRKVRAAEVLSAAMQRLLQSIHFSGRFERDCANGQVLKSGSRRILSATGAGGRCTAAVNRFIPN